MDNKFNFFNYVDHIYVINYIHNNKYDFICKQLKRVNLDVNNISTNKLSFVFDIKYNVLNDFIDYSYIASNINDKINENSIYDINFTESYLKLSLNIYKILKISKYMNYDKILILEDDAVFINDLNYLNNVLKTLNTLNFDLLLGQGYYGFNDMDVFKECVEVNNYFIKLINKKLTSYGAALTIISKSGVNKIIDIYETLKFPITLDVLNNLNNYNLNILSVKKPLVVQDWYDYVKNESEKLNKINKWMNINDYLNNDFN